MAVKKTKPAFGPAQKAELDHLGAELVEARSLLSQVDKRTKELSTSSKKKMEEFGLTEFIGKLCELSISSSTNRTIPISAIFKHPEMGPELILRLAQKSGILTVNRDEFLTWYKAETGKDAQDLIVESPGNTRLLAKLLS